MHARLWVSLLAATAAVVFGRLAIAEDHGEAATVFSTASPAVVKIITRDETGAERSTGSGFLVTEDGWIATNYHVIRGAHAVRVVLPSGAGFESSGAGAVAPEWDTALLKVDGRGLPVLKLSAGASPPVGTRVYAIGSPQGLSNTLSDGLISAYRPLSDLLESVGGTPSKRLAVDSAVSLIQTTASISAGSSGGPLLLADATVIGLTTLQVRTGQSLNFAVPASHVRELLDRKSPLRAFGRLADEEDDRDDESSRIRWRAGPVTVSIRMPARNTDPAATWTVGSTIDDVLAIEGPPTQVIALESGALSFRFAKGDP
ncbi:MAG: trypsin-like peptidase domain-containing protein [Planctomycetia bacterium]|nr:trypsin-like peptidase domain-containing protein [Planctomycetia bacterium]